MANNLCHNPGMNRRLILLRHAKSSWSEGGDDHDRSLNKRGKRDAPRVGLELELRGWRPDFVVCSTARRTRKTWKRMAGATDGWDAIDAVVVPSLYHGSLGDLRAHAAAWSPKHTTVMAIGHNPGWEAAVQLLCGEPHIFTTCNAALLIGAGDTWESALQQPWRLEALIRPRELPELDG